MAYSPNIRAESQGRALAIRSDEIGMLEIKVPGGGPAAVELSHPAATAEQLGLVVSALTLAAFLGVGVLLVKARRRSHHRSR
jgi:hypothetical protein